MKLPSPQVFPVEDEITNQSLVDGVGLPIRISPWAGPDADRVTLKIDKTEKRYEFRDREAGSIYVCLTKQELQAAGNGEHTVSYRIEPSPTSPMPMESDEITITVKLT